MKTSTFLSLIFLSITTISNAQNNSEKNPTGSVSLNGGVSVPVGDFSDVYLGGASSGYNFHMNYSVPLFKSHFGLTTIISTSGYAMTDEPFKAQQRSIINANTIDFKEGIDYDLKSNSIGNYSEARVLLGLYTTLPLTKRMSLDSRILFGVIFIDRPRIDIDFCDYYDSYYPPSYTQLASSSTVFAYDFGLGLRYNLGKKQKLCVMLSLDYVGSSSATFDINCKSLYVDQDGYFAEGSNTITQSYSISSFNTTFGIGYVFGKKEK